MSPDGSRVAAVSQSLTEFGDLYLMDAVAAAEPMRITKSGTDAFYRTGWAGSEIVEYDLPDGTTAWARIWDAPAGATPGATPAVVYAHGCGECAQAVVKGWARAGSIVYANYLLQNGYARSVGGHTGAARVTDTRNRTYAYRQMGISDIDSALPLLDILVDQYGVARDRIGVYGGSYGRLLHPHVPLPEPGEIRRRGGALPGYRLGPLQPGIHEPDPEWQPARRRGGLPGLGVRCTTPMGYRTRCRFSTGWWTTTSRFRTPSGWRRSSSRSRRTSIWSSTPSEDHGWDEIPTRRDSYRRMTDFFDRHLGGGSDGRNPTTDPR